MVLSEEEQFVLKLRQSGANIQTVYDIGASNAAWALKVSPHVGDARFEMFEPLADAKYAQDWLQVNKLNPPFRLHQIALGSENTETTIQIYDDATGSSLIPSTWSGVKERIVVPVRRLDDYSRENKLPPADVIKMDVQGFELEILKGGDEILKSAKALMLETWLYRGYGPATPLLGELIEFLEPRDFLLHSFGGTFTDAEGKLYAIDANFVRKGLIV